MILVTGASGLVGGNVVRELARRGEGVRVLLRRTSKAPALEGLRVERAEGDLRDVESLKRACDGCRGVVHAAADVRMWVPDWNEIREVNVRGTLNLMEASRSAGVERFLHVSTDNVIGLKEDGTPADESTLHNLGHFGLPYMDTKFEADLEVRARIREGFPAIIVMPTFMLGPWDPRPSSGRMVLKAARGQLAGYSSGGKNFVDIEDVADAIANALERGKVGERYLLAGENLTYQEAFTRMNRVVGRPPPRIEIPWWIARRVMKVGDLLCTLLRRELDVSTGTVLFGYLFNYFNPAKAIRELGLRQTPFEASVRKAWDWFRKYGYA